MSEPPPSPPATGPALGVVAHVGRGEEMLRRVPLAASVLVVALALLTIAAWLLHAPGLSRLLPDAPTMRPDTVLGFLLAAGALSLMPGPGTATGSSPRLRAAGALGIGVAVVGVIGIAQGLTPWRLGLDNLLFRRAGFDEPTRLAFAGHMALTTAGAFVLLGLALALASRPGAPRLWRLAPWVTLPGAVTALTGLCRRLFDAVFAQSSPVASNMAVPTALGFLALGVGILWVRPTEERVRRWTTPGAARVMLTRVLPVAALGVLMIRLVDALGAQAGWWSENHGAAISIVTTLVCLGALLWRNAGTIDQAERAVHRGRETLEEQVQQRTLALRDANANLEREVAERRRAQDGRSQFDALVGGLLNSSSIGFALLDADMRFLQINEALSRMNGLVPGAHLGRTVREILPGVASVVEGYIREVAASNRPMVDINITVQTPGGGGAEQSRQVSYYPVRAEDGHLLGVGVFALDMTERRRAEEELRVSEERHRLAIAAAQLGTFYCPAPLATIVWNSRCKEQFWLSPDAEVDFERFYSILHPEDRERTRLAIERALAERGVYDVEYRTVAPDGERFHWIRAIGRGYYDEATGQLSRFDGVTIDISDRKQAEAERAALLDRTEAARAEAEAASRLKDEFVATLSHELRTPLNAILGWTQLLRADVEDRETLTSALEVIERNARAQVQLVEDLLDVSRIITGKMRLEVRPMDLPRVIHAALEAVQPAAAARGVRLQPLLDTRAGPVNGDPDRMQQIVWNLLSNAIKFTPRGGRVQVRLERIGSHAELTVSDTGQGIELEFLPHVFDRFRQADASFSRRHGGLGLGLAIVRHLVEAHGGTVAVRSPGPGQGATFVMCLPLAIVHGSGVARASGGLAVSGGSGDDGAPGGEPSPGPRLNGLRVLAVDDERDSLTLLEAVLTRAGAAVETVGSAAEAFTRLAAGGPNARPDLLISDIGMPGEDGLSLITRVRAQPSGGGLPAVALTAHARPEDRIRALAAGFDLQLAKPVDPSELVLVLSRLMDRAGTG